MEKREDTFNEPRGIMPGAICAAEWRFWTELLIHHERVYLERSETDPCGSAVYCSSGKWANSESRGTVIGRKGKQNKDQAMLGIVPIRNTGFHSHSIGKGGNVMCAAALFCTKSPHESSCRRGQRKRRKNNEPRAVMPGPLTQTEWRFSTELPVHHEGAFGTFEKWPLQVCIGWQFTKIC